MFGRVSSPEFRVSSFELRRSNHGFGSWVFGSWYLGFGLPVLLLSLSLCLGACSPMNLQKSKPLPESFEPRCLYVTDSGAALLGGILANNEALIQRVEGDTSAEAFRHEGWVVALSGFGRDLYGVTGRFEDGGRAWVVLHSDDDGASWTERGTVPSASVGQLLALDGGELWALGAKVLMRSRDGGRSWENVDAPGERNVHGERLIRAPGWVGITSKDGGTLRAVEEGGQLRWRELWPKATILQTEGDYALVEAGGRVKLSRFAEQAGEPKILGLVELPVSLKWPAAFFVDGGQISLIASSASSERGDRARGRYLLQSDDSGKTWKTDRVPGPSFHQNADFGPDGTLYAHGSRGSLLVLPAVQ